jgi:5-methylcytosine-specific restriction endonuclease McrA
MSLDPAIFRALVANGATPEMLLAVVEASASVDEARKARAIPWDELRQRAFERDGYCCTYCGDVDGPFEVDHIHPRVLGGENTLDNVCVACRFCNRSKRDRKQPRRK